MKTTLDYLNEAKQQLGIESDYALAKWLGVTRQAVSSYQTQKSVIDDYAATKIAKALGIDPLEVIAAANFEREKGEGRKKYWANFSQEIAGAPASPSISPTGGRTKNPTGANSPETTLGYLDRAAERLGIASDPALARWLGVTPETLANCREGAAALDDYAAAKIAEILGIPPIEVVAARDYERETLPARRKYWERISTALAVLLLVLGHSPDSFAGADFPGSRPLTAATGVRTPLGTPI